MDQQGCINELIKIIKSSDLLFNHTVFTNMVVIKLWAGTQYIGKVDVHDDVLQVICDANQLYKFMNIYITDLDNFEQFKKALKWLKDQPSQGN